jgi:hypothetical protein
VAKPALGPPYNDAKIGGPMDSNRYGLDAPPVIVIATSTTMAPMRQMASTPKRMRYMDSGMSVEPIT